MNNSRLGAFVAGVALASATVLGGAGVASAQQDEGPVQFSAEGNDNCEVVFTVQNQTNSRFYTIDYQIDGEFDGHEDGTWAERMHAGNDTGDTTRRSSSPAGRVTSPIWTRSPPP